MEVAMSEEFAEKIAKNTAERGINLAKCISGMCHINGLKLNAIADVAGCSPGHFSKQLHGDRKLTDRSKSAIKSVLGVDVVTIYEDISADG